jgi:hypothetical protein
MSKAASIIKCPNCGTFNSGTDHCTNCGTLISFEVKAAQREEQVRSKEMEEIRWKMENPNWAERLKKHRFIPYRIIGWIFYSAFMVVSAIGAAIAWFVAMAAAG